MIATIIPAVTSLQTGTLSHRDFKAVNNMGFELLILPLSFHFPLFLLFNT